MSEVKVNKITPTTELWHITLGDSERYDYNTFRCNLNFCGSNYKFRHNNEYRNNIWWYNHRKYRKATVSWQTGSIKTSGFTAVAGEGYFCDTSSGAFTVTLPASPSAGNLVAIKRLFFYSRYCKYFHK
ncbi:MAG: hypothetical protein CM15mV124_410 [uncultured marine virus]|nr:MAG: hypothetical protein CM15mV124_410 [uncultured marine virus]